MPETKMITPPIQVGHPVYHKLEPSNPLTVVAIYSTAAWVVGTANGALPETCNLADLVTALPDVQAVELTPAEMDDRIKRAKLAQVQHLVKVIARNDNDALSEMLTRLKMAYQGRIHMTPGDDVTPEEMARGLLVSVLMAAIEVGG